MDVVSLQIYKVDGASGDTRYVAEKWEFHDEMMGARYVMLQATSHIPIDWHIGDYIVYRGQRYYLNNVPTVTQNARPGESGDSFVYENVRFDDDQGKMYDCMVLDITPTTGEYVASKGTNYTGSSVFTIYCAETTVQMQDSGGNWHNVTLSPVAYVGGLIQSNLNRLYPSDGWRVDVNPSLSGLDDKVLSFNQWYVPQVLAEIHNQWDVDYICIGRTIKIGYTLNNITGDENASYMFGYGEGYAQRGDDGKSLFRIKRTVNSSQRVITRLRAMGSTRNMPYRYYNKAYELPQSMFVQNLQLPDTFLPMTGTVAKKRDADPQNKTAGNANRDSVYGLDADNLPILRHVLGDTNDAYIDKRDDAASCPEGIREGSAFWDGSNSDLEEIYPTIKSGTYRDLRAANIPDMDGRVPSQGSPTSAYPNYGNDERIDVLLGVDNRTNVGDGVMAETDVHGQLQVVKTVRVAQKTLTWSTSGQSDFMNVSGGSSIAKEQKQDTLYTINGVSKGAYQTEPVTQNVKLFVKYAPSTTASAKVRYRFRIFATDVETGTTSMVAEHISPIQTLQSSGGFTSYELPSIPNVDSATYGERDRTLNIESVSDISVIFALEIADSASVANGTFVYYIDSDQQSVIPEYVWEPQDVADTFMNTPFSIYIKDIGIDLSNISTTGEDAIIHFNTGACGGMDFKWNPNTATPITVGNKKGWKIDITERFTDDTLHVYYPNSLNPLSADDQFVLLNIEFPDAYIRIAELRLLDAATKYLADNSEPKFIYEPEISDIYIKQNMDFCESAGHTEQSIYWNLYAGYKFSMRGIPDTEEQVLPVVDNVTIKSVTIREGEQDIPKVEIVLNNEVEQSTLQKLTVTVDRIYNGIFGRGSGGGSSVSYATLMSLLNSEGKKLFLSKKTNDTANGKITFKEGLEAEKESTMNGIVNQGELVQRGNVIVGDAENHNQPNPIAKSGNFSSGTVGWYLDNLGNMELESLTVRSFLQVTELLINRLQAQEGDTMFSDNDQITDVTTVTNNGATSYILTLKEKWDGYFTAQQEGNIVKGIINTLAAKQMGVSDYSASSTGQGEDDGGNLYYTSWMRITDVFDETTNGKTSRKLRVVLYGDNEVPSQKNFPPCVNMTIARWGCALDPNESGISAGEKLSREKRQRLFFISTSDGRIMKLRGVNKPILEQWNYGTTLGTIPEFMWAWQEVAEKALPTRDYLYAQGIIYQSLIHVNPQGEPIGVYVDKGVWQDNTPYLNYGWNEETGQWETHDVWWLGCKWRCLQSQPVTIGGQTTYYQPKWNSQYWQLVEGNDNLSLELISSNGNSFRVGYVDTIISAHLFYGSIEITDDIEYLYWSWTRHTENSVDGQGNPVYTPADVSWNNAHTGTAIYNPSGSTHGDPTRLHLTNNDMPQAWSRTNRAIFTITAIVDDGRNQTIVRNQVIA